MNRINNINGILTVTPGEKSRPLPKRKMNRVATALLTSVLSVTILSGSAPPAAFASETDRAVNPAAFASERNPGADSAILAAGADRGATSAVVAAKTNPGANPATIAAGANTGANTHAKEEAVYALLDAGGAIDGIYVVNSFGGGDVTDYGRYTSVKMLNTDDSISLDGNRVRFSSDADKVYYEGYLDGAEIPWSFSVRFFLDGKEYAAGETAGKSGALTMKISVKRNDKCDGNFFDDYALQMTAALDAEKCENITADEATIVNAGGNKQLSYIVLPGKEKEFVITADVNNFEMEPISIGGVRMNLDVEFDDSELMDKVQEIQDVAVKLDNGAGGISKGATKLKGGADSFTSGTKSLDDGAVSLKKGVSKLKKGILKMEKGMDKLDGNSATLTNGSAQVKSALGKIKDALSSVSASTDDIAKLVSASSEIKKGIDSLTDGIESLQKSASYKQYKDLMAQKGMDLPALATQNTQAASGIQAQLGGIDAMIGQAGQAGDAATVKALNGLKQQMTQLTKLLNGNSAALSGVGAFNESYFGTLESGVSQLYAGASTLKTNYAAFHGAVSNFADALSGLLANVSELTSAINELTTKYDAFDNGLVKYTDGVSAISKGYSELVSGVSSLTKGSKKLATGASKIHRASSGMTDGVKKLLRGVEKLHDGTGEFCDKTKGMDTEVTDEINSEIASISGSDGETVSFVSAQNKNVTSVQFIIRTKAIKVRESEPKAAVKEKPATFWQRLSHLFGR